MAGQFVSRGRWRPGGRHDVYQFAALGRPPAQEPGQKVSRLATSARLDWPCRQHRRPGGRAAAEGEAGPGFLAVEVRDDGPGGANPGGHGLMLMARRVKARAGLSV